MTDHPGAPWRDRIVGYGAEAPDQLLANPNNARVHPKKQQDVMNDLLDEVGLVQNVIVNKRSGHVVDGHMRVGLAISRGVPSVPVTYVDLDDAEELLMITTFDPLAAMAVFDKASLAGQIPDARERAIPGSPLDDWLRELSARNQPPREPFPASPDDPAAGSPPRPGTATTAVDADHDEDAGAYTQLVELRLTEAEYETFLTHCSTLMASYQVTSLSEAVVRAVASAYAAIEPRPIV